MAKIIYKSEYNKEEAETLHEKENRTGEIKYRKDDEASKIRVIRIHTGKIRMSKGSSEKLGKIPPRAAFLEEKPSFHRGIVEESRLFL